MARLIDAEAVLACIDKAIPRAGALDDYSLGGASMAQGISNKINRGDFDPPKFSAEAVGAMMDRCGLLYKHENTEEIEKLSKHLITYLDQLRESK